MRRPGIEGVFLGLVVGWGAPGAARAFDDHVFVLTSDGTTGQSASVSIDAPWPAALDVEPVGPTATVRHFFGRHYVVNRDAATVQVIDPATFATLRSFSVGAATSPRDIVVVDARTAYVSRYESCRLFRVDPTTGIGAESVDLCPLADADGLPEMSMMALDGRRLLVQLQRFDRKTFTPVPPSYLAVVDVDTEKLVDVDADVPDVQGITLAGTNPSYKMHVEREARRLYVCTPGVWLDGAGGIEAVDLDALRSLGFVTSEQQVTGADISRFVMVSVERGYVIVHTDLFLSSHLTGFSRRDGSSLGEFLFASGLTEGLDHDPLSGQVFMSVPETVSGVAVVDGATGSVLTPAPIPVGLAPADLVVARHTTPGEATGLWVGKEPATGVLSLSYVPACGAPDHHVVVGALDAVGVYGYTGQSCGIGNDGVVPSFDPGPGSSFFLVVADDAAGVEGSYGRDAAGNERPESFVEPFCLFAQDLSRRCD